MALMSCPYCSKAISDRAVACPHCRVSLVVLATVASHSPAVTSGATPPTPRLVKPLAWMDCHPWLTAYAALGVLALPLLVYVATRPFDQYSEALLAGYGLLVAIACLWAGIWLAMPGTTRRQKWRSVAVHGAVLIAVVMSLWLLIAVPVFRYVAVAIALGAAGYGVYRFASGGAGNSGSIYRWGIRAGYAVVFVGAMVHSASDPVPAPSTGQSLPPAAPQQRAPRHYQLGGFIVIYAGLKVVEHFSRRACFAETDTRQVDDVAQAVPHIERSALLAVETSSESKIL